MDASDLRHRLTKQRRLNGSSCIKSDGHSYWNRYHTHNSYGDTRRFPERKFSNWLRGRIKLFKPFAWESRVKCFSMISSGFQGRLRGMFGRRAAENFHYNARKMGIKEKAGDAVNPLNFAGPRSLVELRGARADATKNIDSISSLEPESMKSLKEAELPGYDVSVSFEGPKTLSVLKQKRGAGLQNGAILVASSNRNEENKVKLHSRRDAHKGNFENYDQVGVDQPKVETSAEEEALNHADDDRITRGQHGIGDEKEPCSSATSPERIASSSYTSIWKTEASTGGSIAIAPSPSLHRRRRGDSLPLDWQTRLQIAISIAQGLCYMHHGWFSPIVHRDVKSSNILLDADFKAKIADFGLARILSRNGEPESVSSIAGSFGYMAPECGKLRKVNEKVDVYSFGVVLLELTTGREAADGGEEEDGNLTDWAWRRYREGGAAVADALDEDIIGELPEYLEEAETVFRMGLNCTANDPLVRPTMKQLLQVLMNLERRRNGGWSGDGACSEVTRRRGDSLLESKRNRGSRRKKVADVMEESDESGVSCYAACIDSLL
ncbi:hypothetical protein HPP92_008522 [Vanilla planifolia]|uniref:non-specific serine/threonine protein kinase n=1 Tax=Vanilla planifolia TaxID=51239 RepID=A0A835V5R7_VANPL|nr:hypothetical protein HPP92_008522 [Vanilla planifolia]